MFAIFKRELKAYFTSPLGYVFLAIFYAFSGLFFYIFSLSVGSTDISSVFLMMFMVLMVFVPLLTMRLLSEDKKQKTDQLILTAPVSLLSIVMGKFLAAYAIFAIGVAVMPVYGFVMSTFATVSWLPIWGNTVGLFTSRRYIRFNRSFHIITYGKPDDSGNRRFLYQSYDTAYEYAEKRTPQRIFTGRAFKHLGIFEILRDNKRNIQPVKPDILCERYFYFPVPYGKGT